MGESQLIDVVGEARRELAIGERTIVLFGDAHPGAEVNFVDGDGGVQGVVGGAFFKIASVVPGVVEIPDHRSGARRLLGEKAHRVGFFSLVPVFIGLDMEFV